MPNIEEILKKTVKNKKIDLSDIEEFELNDDEFDELLIILKKHGIEIVSKEDEKPEIEMFDERQNLEDPVRMYLKEIGKIPQLSTEEERILFTKLSELKLAIENARDIKSEKLPQLEKMYEEVREKLIYSNLKLVVHIAKPYGLKSYSMPLLDLIQEGNIGLMKAIEKFEVTKGYKFSTYATCWIRQAVARGIADKARIIRVPVHIVEQRNRVLNIEAKLASERFQKPTYKEISEVTNIPEEKVRDIYKINQEPQSLYSPVGEEGDSFLGDFIPDKTDYIADLISRVDSKNFLQDIKETLLSNAVSNCNNGKTKEERLKNAKRKYMVLCYRYGLVDGRPRTLEEVGQMLHITRERVRQIEQRTFRELKHSRRMKKYSINNNSTEGSVDKFSF